MLSHVSSIIDFAAIRPGVSAASEQPWYLGLVAIEELTKIFNKADDYHNSRSCEPNHEHNLKNSHAVNH
jgi:hypothetical protein